MPSLDFQLRSLVKLTGLNNSANRYYDVVREYKVEEEAGVYDITFKLDSNAEYIEAENINVTGVAGLTSGSKVLDGIVGSDALRISGSTRPEFTVDSFQTWNMTAGVTTYYYLRAFISDGNVINAGSTIEFDDSPAYLTGLDGVDLTVYSANEYSVTFRQTTSASYGLTDEKFPEVYSEPVPPNNFPVNKPKVTNGAGAKMLVTETNGYVAPSRDIASISPVIGYTEGYLTDHNRSALGIDFDEVEEVHRTDDGTLRWKHSASKIKIGMSWRELPADSDGTVDGHMSGKEMLDIYKNNKGSFWIEIYNRDSARKDSVGPDLRKLVRISRFSYNVVKRNFVMSDTGKLTDLWDVNIDFEEV